MEDILDFFRKLFDTADWPPRWHCGNWTGFHGWLYIISDLLIWSAYFAIPLIILRFVSRKSDAKFVRAYFLFAAFILACGSTHLLDAIAFWYPAYRLNALVKFITGVVSWITVFYTIKILPAAMSLKTHTQLEKEMADRKKTEEELKVLNKQLNEAQDIARIGHWEWQVSNNKLTWSDNLYKMYGVTSRPGGLTFEDFMGRIHPDDRAFVNDFIQEAFRTKEFQQYRHRIMLDDGTVKVMESKGEVILDDNGNVVRMIGTGQDITAQHLAQQQLLEKTQALESANIELQKFAYIASHDLQEPLRKILTFASLLEKDFKGTLPEKPQSYIDKIVSSSSRMQKLIEDILRFSNLKSSEEAFETVRLNEVLQEVLSDMEVLIETNKVQIKRDMLPEIEAVPSQMGQLFQNLISNAIKFKKEEEPSVVEIRARHLYGSDLANDPAYNSYIKSLSVNHRIWAKETFVALSVKDNGIGFNPAYAEKIFEIFQRLKNSRSYEGTGIGLAICKKIVDNHRGIILAQSNQNEGAVFTVILPVSQKNFLS